MSRWLITILGITVSMSVFATTTPSTHSHSNMANKLADAWKKSETIVAKENKDELLIVYGGQDISSQPTIIKQTTTV